MKLFCLEPSHKVNWPERKINGFTFTFYPTLLQWVAAMSSRAIQRDKLKISRSLLWDKFLIMCVITVCNSSCGKVMFSQASVILSTRGVSMVKGGMGGGMHSEGMHSGGVQGRGCVWPGGMHGGGVSMAGAYMAGVCAWWGCAWKGACMAEEMATAADGTHPTGMHSCF